MFFRKSNFRKNEYYFSKFRPFLKWFFKNMNHYSNMNHCSKFYVWFISIYVHYYFWFIRILDPFWFIIIFGSPQFLVFYYFRFALNFCSLLFSVHPEFLFTIIFGSREFWFFYSSHLLLVQEHFSFTIIFGLSVF